MAEETQLLATALACTGQTFAGDDVRLATVNSGVLYFAGDRYRPDRETWGAIAEVLTSGTAVERSRSSGGTFAVHPLIVDGETVGILLVDRPARPFADPDRWMTALLANRLAAALENGRLYRQLDTLFRQFIPAEVATALLGNPDQAALGGEIRDVTVLFADLRGYTAYSERARPEVVVDLLNRYFGAVVPVVVAHGGTVTTFIGDAIMALFNAPGLQPDHALRGARAALALHKAVEDVAQGPDWPRFRVGVHTGPALVGNIGSVERRIYTAIGDTVNLASRLESNAEVGGILISDSTQAAIRDVALTTPIGSLSVKGRAEPVQTYRLDGIRAPRARDVTQHIRLR